MRTHLIRLLVLSAIVAALPDSAGAVVADPGYVVGTIAVPDVVAADVAAGGTAIFVGQGSFGAGAQSILRRDLDGTTTTIVTNLNALGGIAYDAAGDRLLFTDNAGDLMGATSGDTVYALPSPLTVAAAVDAATLTLLPSGSIPFAQAVLPLGGGDILIGDAAGPGSGRVVLLSAGVPTNLVSNLDYTAGVALALVGNELLVGNVDGSFVGSIQRYSLAGAPLGALVSGLSGALDQALRWNGDLLVTGGFANDFTSTVVSVTPSGVVDQIASGFGFTSGIEIDGPSQRILVLDFGATHIDTLTPVDGMSPGGFGSKDCQVEAWGGAPDRSNSGKPKTRWTCTDGDPACDRDGTPNGSCGFLVGACFSLSDARTPKCTPLAVDAITVTSKTLPIPATQIGVAAAAVLPSAAPVCGALTSVAVPADRRTRTITLDAAAAGKRVDKDTLKLRCLP